MIVRYGIIIIILLIQDLSKDKRCIQKLRREVERAKRSLSSSYQVKLEVENLFEGEDFTETLTRSKFEELNLDLFRSTLVTVKKVLEDAEMAKADIDEIILVGGSTRIPKVQQLVKDFLTEKNFIRESTLMNLLLMVLLSKEGYCLVNLALKALFYLMLAL